MRLSGKKWNSVKEIQSKAKGIPKFEVCGNALKYLNRKFSLAYFWSLKQEALLTALPGTLSAENFRTTFACLRTCLKCFALHENVYKQNETSWNLITSSMLVLIQNTFSVPEQWKWVECVRREWAFHFPSTSTRHPMKRVRSSDRMLLSSLHPKQDTYRLTLLALCLKLLESLWWGEWDWSKARSDFAWLEVSALTSLGVIHKPRKL